MKTWLDLAGNVMMTSSPILDVVVHNSTMKTLRLRRFFEVKPGQFVMVWLPGDEEKPFSVSYCDENFIDITIQEVGCFSKKLVQTKIGERIGIRGPYGNHFPLQENMLLVGGGMGSAPIFHLQQKLKTQKIHYQSFYGARTFTGIPFRDYLTDDLKTTLVVEDDSGKNKGRVTSFVENYLKQYKPSMICACGPEAMMEALEHLGEKYDIPTFFALERVMKCGIGVCGACVLDSGERVCANGPVFSTCH